MAEEKGMSENLMQMFSEDYMEKLFYFCLKKTGNSYEAEDLASDITLNICIALRKGTIPRNFNAWVWQIARNRYSVWAERKHRVSLAVTGSDISDCEIEDVNADIVDKVISEEETALLRRELALISGDYRNVLVAYYHHNQKIGEIAVRLNLPEGTIMLKLHRARKILKEGMSMARTYGKRSFAPETVEFAQNWNPESGPDGRRYVEHIIAQNILLEAYDNPCTAEELSLELGVAMPYMEDELKFLMEGDLLLCENGKYRTGIVILSKEVQDKIYALSREYVEPLTELVEIAVEEICKSTLLSRNQEFEDMKPTLVEQVLRYHVKQNEEVANHLKGPHTIRHWDGSEWALAGFEKTDYGLKWLEVGSDDLGRQIMMLGNRQIKFELEIEDSQVPVFAVKDEEALLHTSCAEKINALYISYFERCNQLLKEDIPTYLHGKTMICTQIDFRRLVIDRMIETGYIKLKEDMNKSAMGVWKYE